MSTDPLGLASLPPPSVIESLDYEDILTAHLDDLLARHPAAADTLALESEPLVKLVQAHAYRELLYRQRVNEAARAWLLAFAIGADLDHKAAFYGVARLPSESDERLRLRIQLRILALAGNGTRQAYEYLALSASDGVRAARATRPRPGSVLVLVWPHADADASATLADVTTALLSDQHHVIGVIVQTALARPRVVDITAEITRSPLAPADLVDRLTATLPQLIDQHAGLGGTLPRSWLTAQMHNLGAASVTWPEPDQPPELVTLDPDEHLTAGTINLTDSGVLS